MGSGANSYMRKTFLIYTEIRKFFPIYKEPLVIYDFAPDPSYFVYIWGKFSFLFYQCAQNFHEYISIHIPKIVRPLNPLQCLRLKMCLDEQNLQYFSATSVPLLRSYCMFFIVYRVCHDKWKSVSNFSPCFLKFSLLVGTRIVKCTYLLLAH